jgi:hypothetical protein
MSLNKKITWIFVLSMGFISCLVDSVNPMDFPNHRMILETPESFDSVPMELMELAEGSFHDFDDKTAHKTDYKKRALFKQGIAPVSARSEAFAKFMQRIKELRHKKINETRQRNSRKFEQKPSEQRVEAYPAQALPRCAFENSSSLYPSALAYTGASSKLRRDPGYLAESAKGSSSYGQSYASMPRTPGYPTQSHDRRGFAYEPQQIRPSGYSNSSTSRCTAQPQSCQAREVFRDKGLLNCFTPALQVRDGFSSSQFSADSDLCDYMLAKNPVANPVSKSKKKESVKDRLYANIATTVTGYAAQLLGYSQDGKK